MDTADYLMEKVHPKSESPHPKRPSKTLSEGGTNHRQGERASEMGALRRQAGGRSALHPSVRPSVRPKRWAESRVEEGRRKNSIQKGRTNERTGGRTTTDERASERAIQFAARCGPLWSRRPTSGSIEAGCKQGLSLCGRERCAVMAG